MRRTKLILAPITALAALGAASPSLAADVPVSVEPTFAFAPKTESVGVGDTVTWTFNDGGHTTTSLPGQPDKWDSDLEDKGGTFQKTFTKPGRYQYICIPHRDFMKGTIVVGSDTVKTTVGKVERQGQGHQGDDQLQAQRGRGWDAQAHRRRQADGQGQAPEGGQADHRREEAQEGQLQGRPVAVGRLRQQDHQEAVVQGSLSNRSK